MDRTFTHPKTFKPAVMNSANIGKRQPTPLAAPIMAETPVAPPTPAMVQHQSGSKLPAYRAVILDPRIRTRGDVPEKRPQREKLTRNDRGFKTCVGQKQGRQDHKNWHTLLWPTFPQERDTLAGAKWFGGAAPCRESPIALTAALLPVPAPVAFAAFGISCHDPLHIRKPAAKKLCFFETIGRVTAFDLSNDVAAHCAVIDVIFPDRAHLSRP